MRCFTKFLTNVRFGVHVYVYFYVQNDQNYTFTGPYLPTKGFAGGSRGYTLKSGHSFIITSTICSFLLLILTGWGPLEAHDETTWHLCSNGGKQLKHHYATYV